MQPTTAMQDQYANKILYPLIINTLVILCAFVVISLWEIYEKHMLNPLDYDYVSQCKQLLC